MLTARQKVAAALLTLSNLQPLRSSPAGTEFVQPVVGYFCHLCQVIYADEAEAKGQHCSSPAHYRKYQVSGRAFSLTTREQLYQKVS